MASDYAVELSNIVKNVTLTYKFKNFDMAFSDFPIYSGMLWEEFNQEANSLYPCSDDLTVNLSILLIVIQKWKAQGGEIWQLIDPVDGFQ